MSSSKVPTIKLNTGDSIPAFGLGTWKSSPGIVYQTVKDAIDVGYRHIDCALVYGNENEVGAGIQEKIKEGAVKREDLFITSKVWNTYHSTNKVKECLQESLKSLGTEYVDLYLIHWPFGYQEGGELFPKNAEGTVILSDVDYLDTWKGMEECFKLGLAKAIGLSNFNHEQIDRVLSVATVKPAVLQVECHPYLNQTKLIEYCRSKDIVVTAYSPLGSPDRPWAKPDDPKLLDNPKLVELSSKIGKSPAQIVLRWMVQRGVVVIPKTVQKKRLIENLDIFDFTLSQENMDYIKSLDCNGRFLPLEWNKHHKYYPFNLEY